MIEYSSSVIGILILLFALEIIGQMMKYKL